MEQMNDHEQLTSENLEGEGCGIFLKYYLNTHLKRLIRIAKTQSKQSLK